MIHMKEEKATSKRVADEMGGGDSMLCINHSHRNNNNSPGGICAFCLQEKLGKLVSSSFPLPPIASSSSTDSPPSPSFRSTSSSSSLSLPHSNSIHVHHTRSRLPFLNKKSSVTVSSSSASATTTSDAVTFKRSKSTATPRRGKFSEQDDFNFSPRKRNGFWSFLYLSASSSKPSKKFEVKSFKDINGSPRISTVKQKENYLTGSSLARKNDMVVVVEENHDSASSFERKVSRSRSVGCGSRSFSGDIFDRISTGLGDCTLRRVESQREGKNKVAGGGGHSHHNCMKERVKRGGIFGGFVTISSSSSSSSSSYIVSSSVDDGESNGVGLGISHGRSRSRGWTFASPMRAFSSKTSSKDNKRDRNNGVRNDSDKNMSPNLSAIPSLLAVRS